MVEHPQLHVNERTRVGRIPVTLQAVFLASNRGKDVNRPPPKQAAHRVYLRNWFWQRNTQTKAAPEVRKVGKRSKASRKADPIGVSPHVFDQTSKILKSQTEKKAEKEAHSAPGKKKTEVIKKPVSPQDFLDSQLQKRGYSIKRYKTLQSAYYNKPSPLQLASYDVFLIEMVKRGDYNHMEQVMEAGLSPNPCNQFGESLVHMVCRRGDVEMLQVLVDSGCCLQVADDYGRTPLHDACWAAKPAFEVVELIMDVDPRLFYMTDCRGSTPLCYVRNNHWKEWNPFLESKMITHWPDRSTPQGEPKLVQLGANTRPLQDPADSLTCEMAKMVSSGRMHPEEATVLKYDKEDACDSETADSSNSTDEDDYDSEEDSDVDYDSEDEGTDFSLDEDEMADILNTLST